MTVAYYRIDAYHCAIQHSDYVDSSQASDAFHLGRNLSLLSKVVQVVGFEPTCGIPDWKSGAIDQAMRYLHKKNFG